MNINVNKNENSCELNIEGVIKSVSDSQSIKDAFNSCGNIKSVSIEIIDSFSITSSVIGFLLKKKHGDGININIKVNDSRIYELFQSLNLIEVLNVKKA